MEPNKPFDPKKLIGMSNSARKRRARAVAYIVIDECSFIDHGERWATPFHAKRFKFRKFPRHRWDLEQYKEVRTLYRVGQKLRLCQGCLRCRSCSGCELEFEGDMCERCEREIPTSRTICDGSGVVTVAYQVYVELLRRLHHLIAQGYGESSDADSIRDETDVHWEQMTRAEIDLADELSKAMYNDQD